MTLSPLQTGLLSVLRDARLLLEIPQNDFQYSPWKDREAAVHEIDCVIADLSGGAMPRPVVAALLSPSGPIQDVSMASGWQHQFVDIAVRADKLLNPRS